MTTKIGFAAAMLAAAMLVLPAGAQAAKRPVAKTWDCQMFGWLDGSLCKKKVVHKHSKKKYASKKKSNKA